MATKILYVITKANWGGAQRYVYDLARAARSAGFDVLVAYGETGLLVERLQEEAIRTVRVKELGRDVRLGKDIAAYRSLVKLFRKECPDVVHLNSSKAGFTGALAARRVGVPNIIFTAHGWTFNEDRPLPVRMAFMLLHWATIFLCTEVIAVSAFVATHAPRWGMSHKLVTLIRLGIHEHAYLPRHEARDALIELDPALAGTRDELWVGTVAELHRNKGIDVGIAGWQKAALTETQWIVIGSGEEESALQKVSAHLPSIHFIGFVPDAPRYMKAFDLFLLPSRTEALSYTILEAGLAGIPVLCSGVGGTREALGPEYPTMGFFSSEDSDSLAEMLVAAHQNPAYLAQVGEALKTRIWDVFSFDRMVSETLAFYTRSAS